MLLHNLIDSLAKYFPQHIIAHLTSQLANTPVDCKNCLDLGLKFNSFLRARVEQRRVGIAYFFS
jgi:hypothetical protein